jgi:hypothetical protein
VKAKMKENLNELYELDPKPNELAMNRLLKTEPMSVAIDLDELWLGVKSLSNLEIAGFLRNLFK